MAQKCLEYIYQSQTEQNNEIISRSILDHSVGIESEKRLHRLYIPNIKKIDIVQRDDFYLTEANPLPVVPAILDGIPRKLENEEEKGNIKAAEQQLANAFTAVSMYKPLIAYTSTIKDRSTIQKFLPHSPKLVNILEGVTI